jgi:hypothetical protein
MATGIPTATVAPSVGEVIVEIGGVVSRITVTVICVVGFCTFPLVSTARLLIVSCPGALGVNVKLHAVVPVAALKVAPPSTDTSTLTTDPPPVSLAVPVMLTVVPISIVAPSVGDVIVEVGGAVSGVGVGVGVGVGFVRMLGLLVMPHPE